MPFDMHSRLIWQYRQSGRPAPPRPLRTYLLAPYAGGGASAMVELLDALSGPDEQVLTLQYPGRGPRLAEPPAPTLAALAEQATADLRRLVTEGLAAERLVLVGHSLGGLLAYDVAALLEAAGRAPEALVISAARAPRFASLRVEEVAARSRQDWTALLRQDGDAADELLGSPEMLGLAIGALRSDVLLAAGHRPAADVVGCPLLAVGGSGDPDVRPVHLRGWESHTTADATTTVFPGGHFYYRDQPGAVARTIRRHLAPVGVAAGPQPEAGAW